jgi:hypothetical protein
MKQSNVTYNFRNQRVTIGGVEQKRPSVEVAVPEYELEDILAILNGEDTKTQDLIMSAINDLVIVAARAQVDEASFTTLDLSKLDLTYIASVPRAQRAGSISKETWEAFESDYVSTVMAATGKDKERVTKAAKLTAAKFAPVKSDKRVIGILVEQLNVWFSNTAQADAFADVYETLVNRAETLMNTEQSLADAL